MVATSNNQPSPDAANNPILNFTPNHPTIVPPLFARHLAVVNRASVGLVKIW